VLRREWKRLNELFMSYITPPQGPFVSTDAEN